MAFLFGEERVAKAILSFLRELKVGQVVAIPPRGGKGERGAGSEGERDEVEGEEGCQGARRTFIRDRPEGGRDVG